VATDPETLGTFASLMNLLHRSLVASCPGEKFLAQEAEAVLQGLVGSLGWAVLRATRATRTLPVTEPVLSLETTDHFASPWMDRDEILDQIQDTSGISAEAALKALAWLERFVDDQLTREDFVDIEHVGRVRRTGQGYWIQLAEELQIHPARAMVA
jgi:hypothetical protein